jgi:hypothetical protein
MKFSSGMQSVSKGSDLANGFANVLEVTLSETTGWVYPTLYIIEGGTMLPNKTYTFSYYGKASQNITGMNGHFQTNVGQITTGISASFTTSWVKYSYTFTMPSTYNGTFSIYLLNHNTTGTGGITFSIANMQMEEGSVATDFEHRSYGEELALCQRYYQKHISGDLYTGFGHTQNTQIYGYRYIKPMRTPPTLSYSALTDFSIRNVNNTVIGTPTAITHGRPGSQFTNLKFTHASIVTTSAYHIVANGTSNAWIAFDAEL